MRLSDLKQWILALASASALTQMTFAQGAVPAAMPNSSEQIILIQGGKAQPAAPAVAAPAQSTPAQAPAAQAPAAKLDTPAAAPADAAPAAEEKKADDGPWRMFPDAFGGFKVTGWVYGTGVYNASNSGNTRYNGPWTTNDQEGVYLNQLWFNVARGLKEDCFGWGANLDVFFGNDYLSSESRGFENARARGWIPKWWDNQDYGIAIPQAYVEVGTTKYNVRVGHFYTPHGYMVVQAPQNFFNTMPYGFMMTNPFTHWGVQGNAQVTDQLSVMAGVVNGWDALDRPLNQASFMGGVKYAFKDNKGFVSSNIISGQEPENIGTGYASRTLITNIFDIKPTEKFEYVFENNFLWQDNNGAQTSMSHNFCNYFFYKVNDCWKAGFRYEYYRDGGGFTSAERWGNPNNGPNPFNNLGGPYDGYFQSFVAGLNWNPNASKNLVIRPEIRYDVFSGLGNPFNAGTQTDQWVFMVGGIYQF